MALPVNMTQEQTESSWAGQEDEDLGLGLNLL